MQCRPGQVFGSQGWNFSRGAQPTAGEAEPPLAPLTLTTAKVLQWTLKNKTIMNVTFCNCNWGICIAPPTRRPRAHHRVNPYILGARRQNETDMFSDHDETSPSIAAVSALSVACSLLAVQQQKRLRRQFVFATIQNSSFLHLLLPPERPDCGYSLRPRKHELCLTSNLMSTFNKEIFYSIKPWSVLFNQIRFAVTRFCH